MVEVKAEIEVVSKNCPADPRLVKVDVLVKVVVNVELVGVVVVMDELSMLVFAFPDPEDEVVESEVVELDAVEVGSWEVDEVVNSRLAESVVTVVLERESDVVVPVVLAVVVRNPEVVEAATPWMVKPEPGFGTMLS